MPSKTSQRIVGNHTLLALLLHRRCNFAFDDHDSSLLPDALLMCCGGAVYRPESITRDSKIEPRRRRNRVSDTPKSFLGHQNQAEIALEGSRGAKSDQERSKSVTRSPMIAQSGLKLVPIWSQERPSWRQVGPRGAQVGAKLVPRAPKLAPRGAQEAPS